jgi:16S rRNA (guanine966-N2)-methyltransferase
MRIIAGRWRGRRINAPAGREVRPTSDRVREAWMSALGGGVTHARVVDLFAGSGALGLEALSRGAEAVVFVERAKESLRILEANIDSLGAFESVSIIKGDVFAYLERLDEHAFDVALADPPYAGGHALAIAEYFLAHQFASELWLEHRTGDDLPEAQDRRQRSYGDTTLTTYFGS